MKYEVVVTNDLKKLVEKVNEFLKEGYEPYQLDEEESELEDDDLYEKGEN